MVAFTLTSLALGVRGKHEFKARKICIDSFRVARAIVRPFLKKKIKVREKNVMHTTLILDSLSDSLVFPSETYHRTLFL